MILVVLAGCRVVQEPTLQEIPDRFVEMRIEKPREIQAAGGGAPPPEAVETQGMDLKVLSGLLATTGDGQQVKDGVVGGVLGGNGAGDDGAAAEQEALRAWFPEAFLWRPSLQTDGRGQASLDVKVPDQLTTWRVLALAHDDAGHQSGSTHTFESTLPAYVDPVVPGWGFAGDRFVLPVQLVNNRSGPLSGRVQVELSGAVAGSASQVVSLGPYGSSALQVPVETTAAGEAVLSAALPGVDRVRRSWRVSPTGRPVVEQRAGTLGGERAFTLRWPEGMDLRTAAFSIEVQPGPLAVALTELERLDAGGRWQGAYAYRLLGTAERLVEATGAQVDSETLRTVRKRAWQRLVRRARAPEPDDAARLLADLGTQPPESLEQTLRVRLIRLVVQDQRADGTWSRHDRSTVQEVLVQTAATARALPEDEAGARLRASGALERFQPNIDDPFTASVVIASGLLTPTEPVLKTLREGLVPLVPDDPDGPKTVFAPQVASPTGGRATDPEARAWMALALLQLGGDEERTLAGDLASQLLGTYGASTGFGAGRADGILLQAIEAALPSVDVPVQLSLEVDGDPVATAAVDPEQPGVTAVLTGTPRSETTDVVLRGTPSAGLTWTLTQRAWVPWTGEEGLPGVDVEIEQGELTAGRVGRLTLRMAAPSGATVRLVQGLPAGTVVEYPEMIRDRPDVRVFEVEQDRFTLETTSFGAGEIREIFLAVVPRYAGSLNTAPLEITSAGRTALVAPHRWTVR